MAKEFTKKNLQTGDIIETRNGEFGVVILEKDCICDVRCACVSHK